MDYIRFLITAVRLFPLIADLLKSLSSCDCALRKFFTPMEARLFSARMKEAIANKDITKLLELQKEIEARANDAAEKHP